MTAVGPLALVVSCGCGERGRVMPGEVWTCPACGRSYGTSEVPGEEYAEVVRRVNRAKLMALSGIVVIVVLFVPLGLALGAQLWVTGMVLLAVWYFWYGPRHKRVVRRILRDLPQWEVHEQDGDTSQD